MGLFDELGGAIQSGVRAITPGQGSARQIGTDIVSRRKYEFDRATPMERLRLQEKWRNEGQGLFESFVPRSVLDTIADVPLFGNQASRTIEGMTSPAGLAATIATAGTAGVLPVIYGTAGSFAGGEAGLLAEELGVDERLRLDVPLAGPVSIGPRALGETLGGFKQGPKGGSAAAFLDNAPQGGINEAGMFQIKSQLDEVDNAIRNYSSAGAEVDPSLVTRGDQLRIQLEDGPLDKFDITAQIRREGNVNPYVPTVSFEDAMTEILGNRVDSGPLSWMPQPFKVVTDKISRGLALKAGSTEWFALNAHRDIEQIGTRAAYAAQALSVGERRLGLLARDTTLGENVGQFFTGQPLPLMDDVIPNLPVGKGGLQPTIENITSNRSAFKLSPEVNELLDGYEQTIQNVRNDARDMLRKHGMKEANIDAKLPAEPGGYYFHKVAVSPEGEILSGGARRGIGSTQPYQMERVPEGIEVNVKYLGSFAASAKDYAEQVGKVVADETYWKPMFKRLGVSEASQMPREFGVNIDRIKAQREWLTKARKLVTEAKSGRVITAVNKRAAELAQDGQKANIPDEWQHSLTRLTAPFAEQSGETAAEVALRGGNAARAAASETEGLAAYSSTARLVERELKEFGKANNFDLQFAKDQAKLATKRIAGGRFTQLDMAKFPGLSGTYFEKHWADQVEQAWKRYEPPEGFWNAVNQFQGIVQGMQAGTTDIGQFGLQLTSMLKPTTVKMLPSIFKNMWTEGGYLRYMEGSRTRFSKSGASMYDLQSLYGPRMGTEVAEPLALMNRPGGFTRKLAGFVQNTPTNKAFTRSVNMARSTQFEDGVKIAEWLKGGALTPEQYRAIGRNAGMITGDFDWTRAGISQGQRAFERTAVRFAPGWLRSQMQLILTAATPTLRGTEANLARYALGGQIAALTGIYVAMAEAAGQTPNLDPTDVRNFMTIEVKGVKVGPGGPILSLVRTASKMAALAEKAASGDLDAKRKLIDLRDGQNPLHQYWRGGAPTLTGLIYDMVVQGHETYGDNNPLGPDHPKNTAMAFLTSFEPFGVQALREEGPISAAAQFVGGRALPQTAPEAFLDAADDKAHDLGYKRWADVPEAVQKDVLRSDDRLKEMDEKRIEYFGRFGNKQDGVYNQIDKSKQLVEDQSLAAWGAVEAGMMDKSAFRQQFSELQQQHAYLSNRLLDASGDDPTRRSDETKQDYWARLYHAIQPQDSDGDGFPSEAEWKAWRSDRNTFWRDYPEASGFRTYITSEYMTRKWKDPSMASVARELYTAQDLYGQFVEIPKYRGLSAEDAEFIDTVRSLKDRLAREASFSIQSRGGSQSLSSRQAWRLTAQALQEAGVSLTGSREKLLSYAISMDDQRIKAQLLNPERASFLTANPTLVDWYPSALRDAGLDYQQQAQMGMTAPTGTTSDELLGELQPIDAMAMAQ